MEKVPTHSIPPLVSIGIVNWNCDDYLPRCLGSVFSQTHPDLEVILIDNASTDGSADRVAAHFPKVRIVRNPDNRGFAKAHNQAIRMARGKYYMPLNPDVELSPRFVEEMVAALENRPNFGYACGLVYLLTNNLEFQHVVYSAGHLFVRNCHAYNRFEIVQRPPETFQQGEIGGASGVCPLYRKTMLDDIAMGEEYFDETYFMYVEDVDLDWRAHLAGWKCWFTPKAQAWHIMEGTGAATRTRIRAQIAANRYLMIMKNLDRGLAAKQIPYILKFDLSHILPMLARKPMSFLYAAVGLIRGLPSALRKRRIIQSHRRWTPKQIFDWMENNRAELQRTTELAMSSPRPIRRDGQLSWPDQKESVERKSILQ